MGLLRDLGERFATSGVVTIGVFRDHPLDEMIRPFVEKYHVAWPVARDPELSVLRTLGITGETHYAVVMLNRAGQPTMTAEGFGKTAIQQIEAAIKNDIGPRHGHR